MSEHIHVILVTSTYQPDQFKTIKNLCTSDAGVQFALDGVEDILSGDNISVLRKTSNSILDCSAESHSDLLRVVQEKRVMICGVTSTACVDRAVQDLLPYCSTIVVAMDTIACRESATKREADIVNGWKETATTEVSRHGIFVVDSWNELFHTS